MPSKKLCLKSISVMVLILLLSVVSQKTFAYPPPELLPEKYYPLTEAYFQDVLSLNSEFSEISLAYVMTIAHGYENAREQLLSIVSKVDYDGEFYVNKTLDQIEVYEGCYYDYDLPESYSVGYRNNEMMTIFQLINNNAEFYFNALEYDGEEYLEITSPWDLGEDYHNFIILSIDPPDRGHLASVPAKAFIKGWHPGDDPPEEMEPLIDYLENVIIPKARQFPKGP